MAELRTIDGDWYPAVIPANVRVSDGAHIETTYSFHRFRGRHDNAVTIGRGASMYQQTVFDVGPEGRLSVGEFSLLNSIWIVCDQCVTIGSYCLISWNVILMDNRRVPVDPASRASLIRQAIANDFRWPEFSSDARPVTICDNVWIGFDSVVLPGVTIGTGSVIGARSVVAEDVPEYSVAVGNPARVVSQLKRVEEPYRE
jgi:acetyltransferase-like isoleucine patch superfamily enzyme